MITENCYGPLPCQCWIWGSEPAATHAVILFFKYEGILLIELPG